MSPCRQFFPQFCLIILAVFSFSSAFGGTDTISSEQPLHLTADLVQGNAKEKIVVYTGHVIMEHEQIRITCDKLFAYGENELVVCEGNVYGNDTANDAELWAGRAEYRKKERHLTATAGPTLKMSDKNGIMTKVVARQIEFFGAEKRVKAEGDVNIERDKINAVCGHATYFAEPKKVIMTEKPVARQEQNVFEGEKMTIFFGENRIMIDETVKANVYPKTAPGQARGN